MSSNEDRFVAPFYLAMMGTNAIEHADADLLRRVVAVGRDASVRDVVWLLRGEWRPRVMGAWFSLLHDGEAVSMFVGWEYGEYFWDAILDAGATLGIAARTPAAARSPEAVA